MIGPLYFITDPGAPLPVIEQARAAAQGGAWAVQLRDKHASGAELAALAADAHGLHIGQGDGDPAQARARLGPGKLLGLSVETPEQCARIPAGVDHIGAGPLRATASKPDHAAPIGFDGLAAIAARACVPALAIGGVGPGDAAALKRAGVAGMAVVSAVTRAPDPQAATRALVNEWRSA